MIVLASPRQQGRTSTLITWLIGGHRVQGWPQWSRVLVVPTARDVARLIGDYPELQHELWTLGNGGLGKLAISFDELRRMALYGHSRIDPDVTFALDDADVILRNACGGILPALISVEGVASTHTMIADRAREGQS